jgi:hypothetical protein
MFLRVVEDVLQQVTRHVIAYRFAVSDGVLEGCLGSLLELQVALERFDGVLADEELAQVLQIGKPLEEEDALGELVGMLHLAERFFVFLFLQLAEAPIAEHSAMQEVLVGGGQLVLELRIEMFDDLRVAFHRCSWLL